MNLPVFLMDCCVIPEYSSKPRTHSRDDHYLQGQTYKKCVLSVTDTSVLLDKLGLVVHPEKSTFIPTQVLTILGLVINSVAMIVQLTREKATSLQNVGTEF